MPLRLALLLMFFTTTLHALELRVAASCSSCTNEERIRLTSHAQSDRGVAVKSSTLTITAAEQRRVFHGEARCAAGVVGTTLQANQWGSSGGCWAETLDETLDGLAPGKYRVVWMVNGVASNIAAFEIVGGKRTEQPRLVLEPIVFADGSISDAGVISHTRHFDDRRATKWDVVIDGVRCTGGGAIVGGGLDSNPAAGAASVSFLDLTHYRCNGKTPRGWKTLQIDAGAYRSNVVWRRR